jgi:collagenase-like PrtC family protease
MINKNSNLSAVIISRELSSYLSLSKESGRNEVYETMCLMISNDNFLQSLEKLITQNVKAFKLNGKTINIKVSHLKNIKIQSIWFFLVFILLIFFLRKK